MSYPSSEDSSRSVHEQRDWLRVMLSSIGDAVIATDEQGKVTFLNHVAEHLTGWKLPEAEGKPLEEVFRIVNEETRAKVESPSIQAFREERVIDLAKHSILIARDGREHPLDDSAAPISNDAGETVGVVLIFRDIADRRTSERALVKALAYADDIIATLREPFVVLDGDLKVKTANRSFYDSFRVKKEETEGRFVYDLGNGQWDIPGLRSLLDDVLARNKSVHDYEVEHSFPSLGRKTMLLNARPFPPDSKHPELILLAVEDVSALRERADELAAANRHKDEFLATLAHELRNPLAPIRNAVQFLGMEGLKEADAKTARDVVARQVAVMVRLIDDLLDVSRISRNKLDIRKQKVELKAVVEAAVESVGPLVKDCGHEFSVHLPLRPVPVDADPLRLSQVLVNLLNNAAKYTKRGGRIRLSVEREGSDAVIRVEDDGVGIPQSMLKSIFEMFTQVDRSLERAQGGLGIGLTLARRLVEMHDGTIHAYSDGPNQGSEFVVRLPMWIDRTAAAPPTPKSEGQRSTPLVGCRILVVDDNYDSADSLAVLLRAKGNEVHTAYDGLEAVEKAEAFHPELVLLDIGLPKINGYEAARRIREMEWGREAILVALTGWGQDEDRLRSKEAGFDYHLVKPVELAALEKLLTEL